MKLTKAQVVALNELAKNQRMVAGSGTKGKSCDVLVRGGLAEVVQGKKKWIEFSKPYPDGTTGTWDQNSWYVITELGRQFCRTDFCGSPHVGCR